MEKRISSAVLAAGVFGLVTSASAIVPNALVSGGVPAVAGGSNTDYLTDGYLTNWKSSTAKDIALKVGEGPTKLRINWESFGDCAWATTFTSGCGHSGTPLANFKIMTSANSTNGTDGDWTEAAEIKDNPVMARGVDIDFAGKSWFRFVSEGDVGQILEIEAFDMSNGGNDTWFFMGTSISQMGIKQQDTDSTTAQLIHARFPEYTPAMMRGGIGCINSSEIVAHINDYLAYAGNVHFWAIEMGTNDAWGGGDWNLQNYVDNMQIIIDSAKAHNIVPVIARIIATNEAAAGWQINPKFLDALDSLVKVNELPKGPDFYNYFLEHPELIASDGVHPNGDTKGGQAMHHLWAEALLPLYKDDSGKFDTPTSSESGSVVSSSGSVATSSADVGDVSSSGSGAETEVAPKAIQNVRFAVPQIHVSGKSIVVSGVQSAKMTIMDAMGHVVGRQQVNGDALVSAELPAGNYVVLVRDKNISYSGKVMVK